MYLSPSLITGQRKKILTAWLVDMAAPAARSNRSGGSAELIPMSPFFEDSTKEGRCIKIKQILLLLQLGTWRIV